MCFHRVLRSAATHEVCDASRIFHREAPVSAHKKGPVRRRADGVTQPHARCVCAGTYARSSGGVFK